MTYHQLGPSLPSPILKPGTLLYLNLGWTEYAWIDPSDSTLRIQAIPSRLTEPKDFFSLQIEVLLPSPKYQNPHIHTYILKLTKQTEPNSLHRAAQSRQSNIYELHHSTGFLRRRRNRDHRMPNRQKRPRYPQRRRSRREQGEMHIPDSASRM
jgi:hypothetical protein